MFAQTATAVPMRLLDYCKTIFGIDFSSSEFDGRSLVAKVKGASGRCKGSTKGALPFSQVDPIHIAAVSRRLEASIVDGDHPAYPIEDLFARQAIGVIRKMLGGLPPRCTARVTQRRAQ